MEGAFSDSWRKRNVMIRFPGQIVSELYRKGYPSKNLSNMHGPLKFSNVAAHLRPEKILAINEKFRRPDGKVIGTLLIFI